MKKPILSIVVFIFSFSVFGQIENDKQFKPTKNNFSFEVDFTPFNYDKPINLNTFRGRLFINDKIALRMGFNFENKKNSFETPANLNNDDVKMFNTTEEKYTVFGINAGLEFHLLNSKRISPYFGIDLGFENKSSSAIYDNIIEEYNYPEDYSYTIETTEIENSWEGRTYVYDPNSGYYFLVSQSAERAYTNISVNAVAGADIYIIKHLYLGFEIGFGYNSIKDKEVITKVDGKMEETYPEGKNSNFGLNVNNAIRLGVWF